MANDFVLPCSSYLDKFALKKKVDSFFTIIQGNQKYIFSLKSGNPK